MKDCRDWAAHVLYDFNPETAVRNLAIVERECLRLPGKADRADAVAGSA